MRLFLTQARRWPLEVTEPRFSPTQARRSWAGGGDVGAGSGESQVRCPASLRGARGALRFCRQRYPAAILENNSPSPEVGDACSRRQVGGHSPGSVRIRIRIRSRGNHSGQGGAFSPRRLGGDTQASWSHVRGFCCCDWSFPPFPAPPCTRLRRGEAPRVGPQHVHRLRGAYRFPSPLSPQVSLGIPPSSLLPLRNFVLPLYL